MWHWSDLPSEKIGAVLYAIGLGILLFVCKVMANKHFPLLLPALLAVGSGGVYAIMAAHHWSMDDGKQRGWVRPPLRRCCTLRWLDSDARCGTGQSILVWVGERQSS